MTEPPVEKIDCTTSAAAKEKGFLLLCGVFGEATILWRMGKTERRSRPAIPVEKERRGEEVVPVRRVEMV
jgi:hypothetical protein